MRKKDLLQQNLSLFETLQRTQVEMTELKRQLKSALSQVEQLRAEIKSENAEEKQELLSNTESEEECVGETVLKPDVEYASKVIGRIVVSAARYSNMLTSGGDTAHRELVNLILGKTEVSKSEILSIISVDEGLTIKSQKIDAVESAANEYFESVLAQIE